MSQGVQMAAVVSHRPTGPEFRLQRCILPGSEESKVQVNPRRCKRTWLGVSVCARASERSTDYVIGR